MDAIQKRILRRLFNREIIGEKHTAIEHCMDGLPRHLAGDAKDATRVLIKKGYLLAKPTNYGVQVSLNPERLADIKDVIKD